MKTATLEDSYLTFIAMHGSAVPVRTRDEFRHVLANADLVDDVGFPHIKDAHLRALFDCMWAWDACVPDELAGAALRRVA